MKYTKSIFLLLMHWKGPFLVGMAGPAVVFKVSKIQLSSKFRTQG